MNISDLQKIVSQLTPDELVAFSNWFQEFLADVWDRKIEADILAGKLNDAARHTDADFEAGRYTSL